MTNKILHVFINFIQDVIKVKLKCLFSPHKYDNEEEGLYLIMFDNCQQFSHENVLKMKNSEFQL